MKKRINISIEPVVHQFLREEAKRLDIQVSTLITLLAHILAKVVGRAIK
jgi:hypothetical protein